MSPSPTRFEERNVLDRIESSATALLDPQSRTQFIHLFTGTLIGRALLGIPLILAVPIINGLISVLGTLSGAIMGILLGLGVLLLLGLVTGLSEVSLYQSLTGNSSNEPRIALQKAWGQIGSWFAYIGWSALILGGVILITFGIWGSIFAHIFGYSEVSQVNSSTLFIGVIATGVLLGGMIWFFIGIVPGKPHYILSGQKGLRAYIALVKLSHGRWWRVWGNILLAGIIAGLALSIFDIFTSGGPETGLIFSLLTESAGQVFGGTGEYAIDPTTAKNKLSELIAQLDTGIGLWSLVSGIISIGLSIIVSGFLQTFYSIVGRDIITPIPQAHDSI